MWRRKFIFSNVLFWEVTFLEWGSNRQTEYISFPFFLVCERDRKVLPKVSWEGFKVPKNGRVVQPSLDRKVSNSLMEYNLSGVTL